MAVINKVTLPSEDLYDVQTLSIPFGQVDSTSTATAFTATIPGITSLYDGVCVYLKNGVITSASGWTLNINDLGAKPVYQTQAAASRTTTIFNVAYTSLFVYNSSRVEGGCWDYFYGYNSDTNTTAYQVRANQAINEMYADLTRYKICFTMFDGKILPSTTVSNSTGTTKELTTDSFDPYGTIYYYNTTTGVAAGESPSASYMWLLYPTVDLRYGFNTGTTLVAKDNVYIKCSPQTDGSVKLAGNDCIVQSLPSTDDGYVYIYLGKAYDTYRMSLDINHPIYYYKDGAIREWTNAYVPTKVSDLTNDIGYLTNSSTLDATKLTGTVPTSSLPSYVDDVIEYSAQSGFPETGETGKIYVDTSTNLAYRWGGSAYVEISPSLALGTTSSTAFRGDYGDLAYTHAVTNKGSAFASGLYKITTNSEGHVTNATAVQKSDITGLGIPAQDTTYELDGTYDAETNKIATESTVTDAIGDIENKLINPGVSISSPTNGQTLIYDSSESRWVNGEIASTDYVVTVTSTTENDTVTYSANKTYANILSAYNNGKTIYLVYSDAIYALDSYDSTANKMYFSRTHGTNRAYTDTFTISLSNVITYDTKELTTEDSMYKYPLITNIGYDNSTLGNYGRTSVRSYVEGDLFWLGNHQLGRATASISAGDDLVLNTNYVITTISNEFKRLPTIINSLIDAALAEYDDGDALAYGNVETEG